MQACGFETTAFFAVTLKIYLNNIPNNYITFTSTRMGSSCYLAALIPGQSESVFDYPHISRMHFVRHVSAVLVSTP